MGWRKDIGWREEMGWCEEMGWHEGNGSCVKERQWACQQDLQKADITLQGGIRFLLWNTLFIRAARSPVFLLYIFRPQ